MRGFYLLYVPPKHPKTVFFGLQKHRFYILKAMLLQLETYALGFSTLIFDQINENISLNGESDL